MTEDSNLNKALFKYFSGIADDKEKILIREWLSISDRNKREFDLLKNQFDTHKLSFDQEYLENKYDQFKSRISIEEFNTPPNNTFRNHRNYARWFYRIAASLLIVAAFAFAIRSVFNFTGNEITDKVTKDELLYSSTKYGQKLHVNLPDGSEVWLNSGSGIYYPRYFSDSLRKVEIHGEVFFDVAHDATRPFVVFSKSLQAEVLGTSFNIRAFDDESIDKVSLVSGKVKVSAFDKLKNPKQDNQPQVLTPGYQVAYNKENGQKMQESFDIHQTISWKEGQLIFNGDNFHHMVIKLERWYGVEIDYSGNPPEDFIVKGEFSNENLTNVLEVLKFGRDFNYDLNKNKLLITFKKERSL